MTLLSFNAISKRSKPEIVLSSKTLKHSSKMANWNYSTLSQVFLLTLCYHWLTHSISDLLEMTIAKDHYLSAILYVLSFNLRVQTDVLTT